MKTGLKFSNRLPILDCRDTSRRGHSDENRLKHENSGNFGRRKTGQIEIFGGGVRRKPE